MQQTLKSGTRIEIRGLPAFAGFPGVLPESATIARWTEINGPVKNHVYGHPGWHIVRFNDGGKLCVHETAFRIVDNR